MPGKVRPSLRIKTLENVKASNLSQTDKECINNVFRLVDEQRREIEFLREKLSITHDFYYKDEKFI